MTNVDTTDEKDVDLDDPDLDQYIKSFGKSLETGLRVVYRNTFAAHKGVKRKQHLEVLPDGKCTTSSYARRLTATVQL